jgi:pimeloyl-ACP methyl ester carboxylesterase
VLGALLQLGARRWRRRTLARLRAGSVVIATARGPIEVGRAGSAGSTACSFLVLHGTPGGYDQGLAIAALLENSGLPVVAPSRPGYLRTPLDVGRVPAAQADALIALLDALQLRRAVVLAVSGGGPVGVELALRHPGRVARLVLWQAVTSRLPLTHATLPQRIVGRVLATDLGAWLGLTLLRVGARLGLMRAIAPDARTRAHLLRLAATAFPSEPRGEGVANDMRQNRALPAYPLETIRVPTLLVHGTDDHNVPYAQAADAAAAIPRARLVAIPGGTHLSTLVAADAARAIEAFIASAP